MDKINHYVAKMTFLGLAMFPWKRLKKAKNTVKQRILQQKRSKIYENATKLQYLRKTTMIYNDRFCIVFYND